MKLYLLRHGETEWNRSHRFQGRINIQLNEAGRLLARLTRERMPQIDYDRVYVSPLDRAIETAHIMLEGRFPLDRLRIDERVVEICFGDWEGTDIDKAGKDPEHPLYNCLWHPELYDPKSIDPNTKAESFEELVARAADFLNNEIMPLAGPLGRDKSEGGECCQNVLVIAHGALIRALVCAAGYKTIPDFWGTHYLNCCLTTLDITNGKITLEREAEIFYDPKDGAFGWSK